MTLDLTNPDLNQRIANESKRTFKPRWVNSTGEYTARKVKRHQTPAQSQTPRRDAEDIGDDPPESPESTGPQEQQKAGASRVQIIGLHTRNPIVSYNGNVYSCQWASNIGTELLFTEHDPDSALPVLRQLPGHVDLLAASSCRIISNSVLVEPKARMAAPPKKKRRTANGKDPTLIIPVGEQASEKRKGQARFLQRLMEIKEAKGEEDEVTVYTEKRRGRTEWKAYLVEKRKEERKKLEKIVRAHKSAGSVDKAKERLAELDREDERVKEVEEKWLLESHVKGKGRSRNNGGRKRKRMDEDETGSVEQGTPYGESISMPTPQRWEMEGVGDEDDEDMEDYQGEHDEDTGEEMFYDEDDYGDEDADGEDEDT